jgi:tellurite methyltransferase
MNKETAARWDQRYRNTTEPGPVGKLLLQQAALLPDQGSALDLACGTSGNGLFLRRHGLKTQLWDLSARALDLQQQFAKAQELDLTTCLRDCEGSPPAPASFDVIVVQHVLFRPICPALAAALRPGGLLFYQTFLAGSSQGPSNPAFTLAPQELPSLFKQLHQRYYAEGEEGRAYYIGQNPIDQNPIDQNQAGQNCTGQQEDKSCL